MRALALVLLLAAPAGAQIGEPIIERDSVSTVLDMGVVQLLDMIQRKVIDREHPVCLLGRVTADSTIISGIASATVMDESTALAVRFECPQDERFIGVAHNHPPEISIECGVSLDDLMVFFASTKIQVSAHTCYENGQTVIIIRRRDRHDMAVVGFRGRP